MIPTKTLRERMTEATKPALARLLVGAMEMHDAERNGDDARADELREENRREIERLVQAAIEAIGDPCLIKTADSLEPTFTLRAQDRVAAGLISRWIAAAQRHDAPEDKLIEAERCLDAFRAWPTRKWPD